MPRTALTMASIAPTRVAAMFLVAPSWWRQPEPPNLRRLQKIGRIVADRGITRGWEIVSAVPPISGWEADDQEAYRKRYLAHDPVALGVTMQRLPQRLPVIADEIVPMFSNRTRVVTWEDDPIHPASVARDMSAWLSHAEPETYARPRDRREESALLADLAARTFRRSNPDPWERVTRRCVTSRS